MQLRPYQSDAVASVYRHLETRDDNPVVCLPTGSGKSLVIAQICRDVVREWNGRILICSHVREILAQNADKIKAIDPTLQVGVYCAGMSRRDKSQPIIVASVQSVYRKACDFLPFDVCLIDECHLLSPDSNSMYQKLIADLKIINPDIRVVGTTATPFRLSSGLLCGPDELFGSICYEAGVKELIRDGYLCLLKSRSGKASVDTSLIKVRGGEYVADEMSAAFDQDDLVKAACKEIVELTKDRKSVLLFCSSVDHARHVADELNALTGERIGYIIGDTPKEERDQTLKDFKEGRFRFLSNCQVLTTGMDAPNIDTIVLLRATLSPGLYVQMVGRGFRLSPSKEFCSVIDYGGNVQRHGPVDAIRVKDKNKGIGTAPVKECPQCHSLIHASYGVCPDCGFEFPPRELKHGSSADGKPILSGEITDAEFEVRSIRYSLHRKKNNPDAPPTFRVDYSVGWETWISEWVCLEHDGFAGKKALQWWRARTTLPCAEGVEHAVAIARAGGLTGATKITVREISGQHFPRIIKYELAEPFVPGESWEMPEAPSVPRSREFTPAGFEWMRLEEDVVNVIDRPSREEEIPF